MDASAEQVIVMSAITAGILLLLAPVAPPIAAVLGFVGILALGGSILLGVRLIGGLIDDLTVEVEPEPEPVDPVEELQEEYVETDMSEEEFERQLEELEDEL